MNSSAPPGCFHCGEPLPPDPVRVRLDGAEREVCCTGCGAAASWIRDAGLGDYYRLRDSAGARVDLAPTDYSAWDRADVQSGHAIDTPTGRRRGEMPKAHDQAVAQGTARAQARQLAHGPVLCDGQFWRGHLQVAGAKGLARHILGIGGVIAAGVEQVEAILQDAAMYWEDADALLDKDRSSICGALLALNVLALVANILSFSGIEAFPGMSINIYTQVGLVTLIGLISKHGIMIVEFANQLQLEGKDLEPTPENILMVYTEWTWIKDQAQEFVNNRANFFR